MRSPCVCSLNRLRSALIALRYGTLCVIACGGSTACGDARHPLGTGLAASPSGLDSPSSPSPGDNSGDTQGDVIGLCRDGANLELIDDMEDQRQAILAIEGRAGQWFSFNDETGEQQPMPGAALFPMAELDPTRGDSRFGVHTFGCGFSVWGAGVGFELFSTNPYDASRYAGISLWVRSDAQQPSELRVSVTDGNTSQYGRVCDLDCQPPDVGPASDMGLGDGICQKDASPCYDDFGAWLQLTNDWQRIDLLWSDLSQRGWSNHIHPSILSQEVYGFRFQTDPDARFDFFIDDVAFLCP